MRLLIYLVALLSGFSAADAACPQGEKASAAVALATVVTTGAASEAIVGEQSAAAKLEPAGMGSRGNEHRFATLDDIAVATPVSRMDLQRE